MKNVKEPSNIEHMQEEPVEQKDEPKGIMIVWKELKINDMEKQD